jgi:hypothetical protein
MPLGTADGGRMTKFGLALPSGASSDGIVSAADDWDAFAEAYVIILSKCNEIKSPREKLHFTAHK